VSVETIGLRPRVSFGCAGGVDNYLLHTSEEKLASETGVRLKKMLLKAQQAQDAAHATTLAAGAVEAAPTPAALR